MKKAALILLCTLLFCGCGAESPKKNDGYDREKAVSYAKQYASRRNTEYADLENNCTNFVSQVLIAGGKQMDAGASPTPGRRITYYDEPNLWFSSSMQSDPCRWKEFSVSTSFVNLQSFLNYWVDKRGMKTERHPTSIDGLLKIYDKAELGDLIILYGEDGSPEHLCVITIKEDYVLAVSANTLDFYNKNILKISSARYPEAGLIKII